MGGGALKNVRRYQRDEYKVLEAEVLSVVQKYFRSYYVPPYFDSKESFGDVDVLVNVDRDDDPCESSQQRASNDEDNVVVQSKQKTRNKSFEIIAKSLPEEFDSKEVVKNGNVYSMEYRDFQVDIITCTNETFECYKFFLGNGDLGMILGMICRNSGLKFGSDGLWAHAYNEYHDSEDHGRDVDIGTVRFSSDPREIRNFLGLNESIWSRGIRSERDVFDYSTSSRIFSPELFLRSRNNTPGTKRDRDRPGFSRFVETVRKEYANEITAQNEENRDEDREERRRRRRRDLFLEAVTYFGKEEEYRSMVERHKRAAEVKRKFSGNLVISVMNELDNGDDVAAEESGDNGSDEDVAKAEIDVVVVSDSGDEDERPRARDSSRQTKTSYDNAEASSVVAEEVTSREAKRRARRRANRARVQRNKDVGHVVKTFKESVANNETKSLSKGGAREDVSTGFVSTVATNKIDDRTVKSLFDDWVLTKSEAEIREQLKRHYRELKMRDSFGKEKEQVK